MTEQQKAFARYAWWTLWATVAVILWGTVVRATGSGAGCGSHWPLCNGEIVPLAPAWETVIEFGHRLTSGVALILVVVLVVWARRVWPARHRVRKAAWWSLAVMVGEALLGAGLVLLEYVADNADLARGWWVGGHLLNTYLLLAVLTVTAYFADGGAAASWRNRHGPRLGVLLLLIGVLGMSGALTALGDTLFPARDLAHGSALTFSPDSHLFVRLRVWHPVLAIVALVVLVATVWRIALETDEPAVSRLARTLVGLYVLQLAIGILNVWWLAPIWLQVVHLLVADLIWIVLILFSLRVLRVPEPAAAPA